ncbi:hypothetical protein FOZ63_030624 [Perkinsus olseni]|uniref:Uncharacterized protein n=1 Tax=Perkinsus olseni TaxID=32597 RepID=A0A7J6RN00_PEROL|nr:hypothetical protein FOZ62_000521 [Perkinsus olseni]KAF4736827.1 hypothetical protein FOZ63_030624 [Perkinsus olseni]
MRCWKGLIPTLARDGIPRGRERDHRRGRVSAWYRWARDQQLMSFVPPVETKVFVGDFTNVRRLILGEDHAELASDLVEQAINSIDELSMMTCESEIIIAQGSEETRWAQNGGRTLPFVIDTFVRRSGERPPSREVTRRERHEHRSALPHGETVIRGRRKREIPQPTVRTRADRMTNAPRSRPLAWEPTNHE